MKLKPIFPFEPLSTDTIPTGEQWVAQFKWDGVRILTYFDGENLQLFNRRKNERTHHFPELTSVKDYCDAGSIILDGEVIALNPDGLPSFHAVMRRDAIRNMDKVKHMIHDVPVYYIVFDILYLNGEWIVDKPLHERMDLLTTVIKPNHHIQIIKSHEEADTLFEITKQQGMEGIIVKNIHKPYKLNKKDDSWVKIKNYRDIIAVIGGVTYRDDTVNSILLGLYNEQGELLYVGHAGTGKMSKEDWTHLTALIKPLCIKERPFVNKPERSHKTQWLKPQLTVKIKYIEWPKGRSLRQPSIQAFTNIPPEECILPEV